MDLIRVILSILLPPLDVFLQVGFTGQFFLNILLTLLGYIPKPLEDAGFSKSIKGHPRHYSCRCGSSPNVSQ